MSPRRLWMMRHPEIAKPRQEGTELGMFAVSAELLMVAVLLAVGVHLVLTPTEPDIVAWFAFGLIVLFLFDVVRRIMNIAKGRAPA